MYERNIDWLLQLGTGPTTLACALTRNRIGDLLLCRTTLNQLSQGCLAFKKKKVYQLLL